MHIDHHILRPRFRGGNFLVSDLMGAGEDHRVRFHEMTVRPSLRTASSSNGVIFHRCPLDHQAKRCHLRIKKARAYRPRLMKTKLR